MPPSTPTEVALTALAQAAGMHALPVFVGLLALLLVAVGMVDWSVRRVARQRRGREVHPLESLAVGLVLGFALVVGAGYLFAVLAQEVVAVEGLARVDQAFSDAVHRSTSASVLQAFGWITHLGDPATLLALAVGVVGVLLVRGERLLALAYVMAVGGNTLLNPALKRVFERSRPLATDGLAFDGWSFPSGHSSGSLVAYGMLAYVLMRTLGRGWHRPAVLLAAAVAFTVGASRIFLQAHFASDVLAGFASATAWLTVCIVSTELVRRRRR